MRSHPLLFIDIARSGIHSQYESRRGYSWLFATAEMSPKSVMACQLTLFTEALVSGQDALDIGATMPVSLISLLPIFTL
jgi:hypothetical protein